MRNSNPASPLTMSLNGGYPSANSPVNGIGNDYNLRNPSSPRMVVDMGRVVDVWPLANTCLVLSSFNALVRCVFPSLGAATVYGGMHSYCPVVGENVLYAKSADATHGIVIGGIVPLASVLPGTQIITPQLNGMRNSFYEMLDGKTFKHENLYEASLALSPANTIPGEIVNVNEHHVGTILGKLYYRMQAGELVSITMNMIDDLMAVMAHNLKVNSSGMRIHSYSDFGYVNTQITFSPTLLGNLGGDGTNRFWCGWFSAGVSLLCDGGAGSQSERWSDEIGILSDKTTVGGWMSKFNKIYRRKRVREYDDPTNLGDLSPDALVERRGFNIAPKAPTPAAFGCQARDYVAWQTAGPPKWVRHEPYPKDWSTFTAEAGGYPGIDGDQYGSFTDVEKNKPTNKDVEKDYNEFRQGEAFCGILPDGSVLLRDAWGSSIELRAGRIVITNAKDTEIVSGANTIITSGRDLIIRAQDSAEIHTTNDRVRIRGGRDIFLDAKTGGIQLTAMQPTLPDLDKKGNEYSGHAITLRTTGQLLFRAPNISSIADNVFAVMGPSDNPTQQPAIFTRSSVFVDWTGAYLNLVASEPTWKRERSALISGGNEYLGQNIVIGKSFIGEEYSIVNRSVLAMQNIMCNGLVGSLGNGACDWYVCPLDPDYPIEFPDMSEFYEKLDTAGETMFSEQTVRLIRSPFEEEQEGSDSRIYSNIAWKYRKMQEYGTENYLWFENFWQRTYESQLSAWSGLSQDRDVDGEAVFPGKEHITGDKKSYWTYKEENVFKDGTPKNPENQKIEGGEFTALTFPEMKFNR